MNTLVVLAKAPRPGLAKTRLASSGRISREQSAHLARAFLEDTLACVQRAAADRRWVGFAPADARDEFAALAPQCELFEQAAGDLGARIVHGFERAFAAGAARVVVIGSDTPHIGEARLAGAFEQLESADVVLGPARDGGYYLVGLAQPRPELFERIEWSTDRVRAQTLARAEQADLRVALLDELDDIDGEVELSLLAARLVLTPQLAPATARALSELRRSR